MLVSVLSHLNAVEFPLSEPPTCGSDIALSLINLLQPCTDLYFVLFQQKSIPLPQRDFLGLNPPLPPAPPPTHLSGNLSQFLFILFLLKHFGFLRPSCLLGISKYLTLLGVGMDIFSGTLHFQ